MNRMTETNKNLGFRMQPSGLHDYAVFSIVSTEDEQFIDAEIIIPCVDVVAERIIKNAINPITQEEAEREAKEIIMRAFRDSDEVYKIEQAGEPDLEIVERLKLLCFKIFGWSSSCDKYYLMSQYENNYYQLEAYQALVFKTVDPQSFLLYKPEIFQHVLGTQIYNECIAAITEIKGW